MYPLPEHRLCGGVHILRPSFLVHHQDTVGVALQQGAKIGLASGDLIPHVLPLHGILDGPGQEARVDVVLGKEILAPVLHGPQPCVVVRPSGHHQDRNLRVGGDHLLKGVQTLGVGQAQVQEHHVYVLTGQQVKAIRQALLVTQLEQICPGVLEHDPHQLRKIQIIFDHQDVDRAATRIHGSPTFLGPFFFPLAVSPSVPELPPSHIWYQPYCQSFGLPAKEADLLELP